MNYVFAGMILIALVVGIVSGRWQEISNACLSEGQKAVELIISISGMICLWSGVMKIAERSGLNDKIARLLWPLTGRIFKGLKKDGKALKAISMNMTANLLGLGNAATPLGIMAMKELYEEENCDGRATNRMVAFVVLNTASIQLIPLTSGALRMAAGSTAPFEILPAVWVASLCSVTVGLFMAKLLGGKNPIEVRRRWGK